MSIISMEDVLARLDSMEVQLQEERARGDALTTKVARLESLLAGHNRLDGEGDDTEDRTDKRIRHLDARVDAISLDIFQVSDQFPQLSSNVYAHSVMHIANTIRELVSSGSRFKGALIELSEEDKTLVLRSEGQIRNTPIFNDDITTIVDDCAGLLLEQVHRNGWSIVGAANERSGPAGFLVTVIKRLIVIGCNQLGRGLNCAIETIKRLYFRIGWHIAGGDTSAFSSASDALASEFVASPHDCATHVWCFVNGGCTNGFPRGSSTSTSAFMMSIAGFYITTTCTLSSVGERGHRVFLLEGPGTIMHYLEVRSPS